MEPEIKNTLTYAGITCVIILIINVICVLIVIFVNKNQNKKFLDRISTSNAWMKNISQYAKDILNGLLK